MTLPQSKIKVDSIEAYDPPGPVVVSYGATVPSGQQFSVNGSVTVNETIIASSFVGDGSALTNIDVATPGKAIALTFIT
jgi:hypothetical protein